MKIIVKSGLVDRCVKSVVVILLMVAVLASGGWLLETSRSTVSKVRTGADDASGLSDLSWDSTLGVAYRYPVSRKWNAFVFSFLTNASDGACTDIEIWGYSRLSNAKLLWVGGAVAGTGREDSTLLYICDTITTTTDETAQGVALKDAGANNRHATLRFDGAENGYVVVLFPTVTGAGTPVFTCEMVGY